MIIERYVQIQPLSNNAEGTSGEVLQSTERPQCHSKTASLKRVYITTFLWASRDLDCAGSAVWCHTVIFSRFLSSIHLNCLRECFNTVCCDGPAMFCGWLFIGMGESRWWLNIHVLCELILSVPAELNLFPLFISCRAHWLQLTIT